MAAHKPPIDDCLGWLVIRDEADRNTISPVDDGRLSLITAPRPSDELSFGAILVALLPVIHERTRLRLIATGL
ncbi:hypothetical protein PG988_001512 [Apiospora saccharicola]